MKDRNLLCEQLLLGCLLLMDTNEGIRIAVEAGLEAADFADRENGRIYGAMVDLFAAGHSVDVLAVKDELELGLADDDIARTTFLFSRLDGAPRPDRLPDYIRLVRYYAWIRLGGRSLAPQHVFAHGEVVAILMRAEEQHDWDPIEEAEGVLRLLSPAFTAQDARRLVGITRRQAQGLLEIAKGNARATRGATRAIRRRGQALRHLDGLLARAGEAARA